MPKQKIIKDLVILASIFGGAFLLILTFWFLKSPPQQVNTYWVEKEGGDGPYNLKTGSRSEEARRKELDRDLQLDGPFIILQTTSDVSIIFTTPAVGRSEEFNQSDIIPQVKY